MNDRELDADVVIVGYGPVGAVAANRLGAHDPRVAVFEATDDVYHLPRAAHLDGEVLRVLQSVGLADTVASMSSIVRGMDFVTGDGKRLFGFHTSELAPRFGWPTGCFF